MRTLPPAQLNHVTFRISDVDSMADFRDFAERTDEEVA
jgi:hypothetical protein